MKIFKFLAVALVAMLGFTACDKDCDHDFIEYDNTKNLVGTWTYLEEGQAEAMVINPDGSFEVTGVMKGGNGSLYEEKGSINVVNNKVSLVFEGDNDVIEGRLELVAGKSMSIVINEEYDIRLTYNYCENDLSDEIVGMWVCNDSKMDAQNDMMIQTFDANGKTTLTGFLPMEDNPEFVLNDKTDYKVVGDLMFLAVPAEFVGGDKPMYIAEKLIYSTVASTLGDVMIFTNYSSDDSELKSETWFRIKQSLNLTGKTYDYSTAYVTSAKGKDEDFTIMGNTFNIAKIKAYDFDKMFSANLFCVELNANSFKYKLRLDNGQYTGFDTPMTIDGNKVTLDMSAINPALRKVEMHMFQDANDTQVHFYMHTDAFINYFANMEVYTLIMEGKINPADSTTVAKVFADMEARVESINVSFVMKARK